MQKIRISLSEQELSRLEAILDGIFGFNKKEGFETSGIDLGSMSKKGSFSLSYGGDASVDLRFEGKTYDGTLEIDETNLNYGKFLDECRRDLAPIYNVLAPIYNVSLVQKAEERQAI